MRMFAKSLLFLNLILSMIFLGWGIGLYTQRLDWAPHKSIIKSVLNEEGAVDEKSGRLYNLHEEIKTMIEARDLAEKRYNHDNFVLPDLENRREKYKNWYADQRALAEYGRDTTSREEKIPVLKLVRDDKDPIGMLVIDKREPLTSREEAVKHINYYTDEYKKLKKEIDDVQVEIDKLVGENQALTEEIAGIPGKKRGLRGALEALTIYKGKFDDEILVLRPQLVAQTINVEQQKLRLKELEGRFKVLAARAGLPDMQPE